MPSPSTPTTASAVVFDCDGVLVDSEPLHARATREYFQTRGVSLNHSDFTDLIGMRVRDQLAWLLQQHHLDDQVETVYADREEHFWSLVQHGIATSPGAAATIKHLDAAGLPVAVATSGTTRWVTHVLDTLGVRDHVASVTSAEDVTKPKPDPQPYLIAAERLGIPPHQCVAVEDSTAGVTSAAAAGMTVVVYAPDQREGPVSAQQQPTIRSMIDLLPHLGLAPNPIA